ncbi:MAG TPA: diaminopimelate decarboxylase [Gemmatimonadales bacterium]|nr:diaminopimelate decarboxylase [Gemmatimonadales bacterium]
MGKGLLSEARARSTPPEARARLLEEAGLERVKGELYDGGVSLARVADAIGTPAFVYNADVISQRYRLLDDALGAIPHRISYAVKANSNLAILRLLRDLGTGADIVSGGELQRVLAAGFPAERVVFSGVGKTDVELEFAVQSGVGHIHLESAAELDALAPIAERLRRKASVGIRVNPDVTADTHPFIATGQGGIKFGVPVDQVVRMAQTIARNRWLSLDTVAMHLGSQLLDTSPYVEGVSRLLGIVKDLERAGVSSIRTLDIGGGLGVRYHDESPLDPATLAAAIAPLVADTGLTISLEPGRYLVAAAGVLLTSVVFRKHSGGRDVVIVDAGMNDLVRPSHYQAWHEIVEVREAGRPVGRVDVVGPVCESGDFLALDRDLAGVERGERLALLGAGAYGFAMSSNYNSRPRAAEVLVRDGNFQVIRPRESIEDLMRGETLGGD